MTVLSWTVTAAAGISFGSTPMTNDPRVSVVIPTYNRAGLLVRTIDNVFEQTYRDFELIIVDDGSTDETPAVLRRYGERLRVLTQDNAGPSAARNHGAGIARGEFLAFQDSDDLWHPTKLERQVALLEMDRHIPCCLCNVLMRIVDGRPFTAFDHSWVRLLQEEGVWFNVLDILATRFILFNQAAVIRRTAFDKVGGFPEDLRYLEDYDLPLRLALEGPWAFIREPLVTYGENTPMSVSGQARLDPITLRECELSIYQRMLATLGNNAAHDGPRRSLKRRSTIARHHLDAAKLQQGGQPLAQAVAAAVLVWDRYRLAALRRSPWFPQPRTQPAAKRGLTPSLATAPRT